MSKTGQTQGERARQIARQNGVSRQELLQKPGLLRHFIERARTAGGFVERDKNYD